VRNRAAAVAFVCLIVGLCSCSSGSGTATSTTTATPRTIIEHLTTTTPSTLPPAQLKAALASFFASKGGKALLEFEKVSAPLSAGRLLHANECKPYVAKFARIASADYLIGQTQLIADPYLAKKFHDEIALKQLFLEACLTGAPLPARTGPLIQRYTAALRAEMAKHGYTI
jgi:hypothetical protein